MNPPTPLLGIPQDPQSQYLAQALQQMRQGQRGPNIRTPGAFASNMLAEALNNWNPQMKMAGITPPQMPTDPNAGFSMAQARQIPTGGFFGG